MISGSEGETSEKSVSPIKKDLSFWIKAALSVFLLYHLSAVLLLPNGSSIIGRRFGQIFTPYANTLGLNTTWQFFSPGPSPEFFLEYRIETSESYDQDEAPTLRYPPEKEPFAVDDFYNRRLYGMRFMALNPERLEKYFIPFLCRQAPGALYISLQSIVVELPALDRAGKYLKNEQIGERIDLPSQRYDCPVSDPALKEAADGADFVVDPSLEKDPASQVSEETGLPHAEAFGSGGAEQEGAE